jgi:hypothetical protein
MNIQSMEEAGEAFAPAYRHPTLPRASRAAWVASSVLAICSINALGCMVYGVVREFAALGHYVRTVWAML